MKKAVLVVRVSDPRQERDGLSLDNQEQALKQYAKDRGYQIAREFRFQETADLKIRTKFLEVIRYLKSRKDVVALIGYRVDRLTRNFRDHVAIDDLRTEQGKELHFVYDRLVISAKTVGLEIQQWDTQVYLAKMYLNRLKADAAVTIKYKLDRGEWPGKAPYGYRNLKDGSRKSRVLPVKPEAEIVHRIYKDYSTGAFSMDAIKRRIKEEFHVDLPKSKIEHILGNPFYMGQMRFGDKLYHHVYEPLISEMTYLKVQHHRESFHKNSFKYAGLPYAYRGLIVCGKCGCRITPERKVKKGKAYTYYHCTGFKGKHNAPWLLEADLTAVFEKLLATLRLPEHEFQHFLKALQSAHRSKVDFSTQLRADWEAGYRKYEERIERMYEDKLDGEVTQDHFDKQKAKYRALQAEITAKLEQLNSSDDEYYETAERLLYVCQNAGELFSKGDASQKQLILNLLLQNCELKEKTLVWELKKPFDTVFSHASRLIWLPLLDMFLDRQVELYAGMEEIAQFSRLLGVATCQAR